MGEGEDKKAYLEKQNEVRRERKKKWTQSEVDAEKEKARARRMRRTPAQREAAAEKHKEGQRVRRGNLTQEEREAKNQKERERKLRITPAEKAEKSQKLLEKWAASLEADRAERGVPPGSKKSTDRASVETLRKWSREERQELEDPAGLEAKRAADRAKWRNQKQRRRVAAGKEPPPGEVEEAEIDRMIAEYGLSGLLPGAEQSLPEPSRLPTPDDDVFAGLEDIENIGMQARTRRRARGNARVRQRARPRARGRARGQGRGRGRGRR